MADMLYTPDTFAQKTEEFIKYCDDNGIDATDYQIIKFFGISPSTLDRYRAGDNKESKSKDKYKDKYKGFGVILKKIDMYREDATIRQVVINPKLAGHAAFKLKQAHWGGWSDKQETSSDIKVDVQISSAGNNPFG